MRFLTNVFVASAAVVEALGVNTVANRLGAFARAVRKRNRSEEETDETGSKKPKLENDLIVIV